MDALDTALHGQNTTPGGRLYMAFELGEKSWKLSLGDGRRAPSRCTVAAGDTTAVLAVIANARVRCHLGADAPVYSCYEAGRDGFWLEVQQERQVRSGAHPGMALLAQLAGIGTGSAWTLQAANEVGRQRHNLRLTGCLRPVYVWS